MKGQQKKSKTPSIVSKSDSELDSYKTGDLILAMNEADANTPRKRSSLRRGSGTKPKSGPVRAFVEHHYHDHARDPIVEPMEMVGSRSDGAMSRSFPEKLHQLLETMEEESTEHIVSWQPHGRCFVIHDKTAFVDEIMPRFFMQTKLTSFQRQLNLYSFVRLTTGPDRGGYYNEFFLRGRPDLCRNMVRTRVKGIGMKAASSPATEPNFYSYESCPPTGSIKAVSDDTDGSVSSRNTESCINTVFSTPVMPNIVSPPGTPILSSATVKMSDSMPSSCLLDIGQIEDDEEKFTPHTGDEVFFEGHKFRYLDHLDLDDVHEITVTNVEYL